MQKIAKIFLEKLLNKYNYIIKRQILFEPVTRQRRMIFLKGMEIILIYFKVLLLINRVSADFKLEYLAKK